jgi:hypothetical protein
MDIRRSVFFALVILLSVPAGVRSQPVLVVQGGTNIDFGLVYTGRKFVKNVTLKNIGTDTLVISQLSASCGCTGTLLGHDRIPPRDSSTLTITFNSSRFLGKVDKAVTMSSNDPGQPNVRIVFVANVVRVFSLEPEYVVFKTIPDSTVTDTVVLQNISASPVHLLSVESSSPLVKIRTDKKSLSPGEALNILLTFSSNALGTAKGNIAIQTDQENLPALDVRFFALITKHISP